MADSSKTSKKQSRIQSRLRKLLPLYSNDVGPAGLPPTNPLKSRIVVPETSSLSLPDQLSSRSVTLSPTPPSTSPVPADAASGHILNMVLEQLSEDDKRVIDEFISSDGEISSVLSTVYTACKEKREFCEKMRWRCRLRGRTVWLREEADKVVFWLDKFKQVGDIAANVDPMHAGLPWAGIRLLLEAATTDSRQMAALLEGLNTALYMMNRLKLYLNYLRTLSYFQSQTQFKESLICLYALILEFLAGAIRIYRKNSLTRAFAAFWTLEGVQEFEAKCEKLANRVEIDAQNCDRDFTAQSVKELQVRLEQLKDLHRMNNPINEIWSRLKEDEQTKILQWISQIAYLDNHESASDGRTEGTAEWIFDRPEYLEWETLQESQILWLHGIPGAGKTKLTANVINHLSNRPNDQAMAYFYCNRNEESRRDPGNVLRCFVKQLAISQDKQAIRDVVLQMYKEKQGTGFASTHLTYKEAEGLLPKLMRPYSQTTLVIDALDECHEESRLKLIATFDRLIEDLPQLKIFISSRRDGDIKHQLHKKANLGIEATDNQNDIAKFVHDTIETNQQQRRLPISDDLRKQIVETLLHKSRGMFQWAYLQIHDLLSHDREADIRIHLSQLPDGIKGAYDKIFMSIQCQKGSKPNIAIRAFQCIMASVEPLDAQALVAAVCQDPNNPIPQPVDIDTEFVLSSCQNLIIIDHQKEPEWERGREVIRFSHLSVREYLEVHQSSIAEKSDEFIANMYLSLLSIPRIWDLQCRIESSKEMPLKRLLEYVGLFWPDQVHRALQTATQNNVATFLRQFLLSDDTTSQCYKEWYQWFSNVARNTYKLMITVSRRPSLFHDFIELIPLNSMLIPICLFGFEPLLVELFETKARDVNEKNSRGLSLLSLAARSGKIAIVQLLLDNGADVNVRIGGRCGSALAVAAHERKKAIVQLLLDNSADVNAKLSGSYGSALAAAAYGGDEAIVQLLLDNGADVNAQLSGSYGSALAAAGGQYGRDETIVQLLLDNGADVNARLGGPYGSALTVAAHTCNDGIVRCLLENGADINCLRTDYCSPLVLLPALNGKLDMLRLIYEQYDAQRQFVDSHGRTPLHFAAMGRCAETFGYLVGLGLDPAAKDVIGNSLLHYAASGGSLKVVNMAIDQNLSSPSQDGRWTPLHWACRSGNREVVERLISAGFRGDSVITSRPEREWTPYSVAVAHGNMTMLEELPSSSRALLGSAANSSVMDILYQYVNNSTGYSCDGCFHDIYGPRFHCQDCDDFDYCFMCESFSKLVHPGHSWECIEDLDYGIA